jgi:hypothetical protein
MFSPGVRWSYRLSRGPIWCPLGPMFGPSWLEGSITMWKVGDIAPVSVLGVDGYPYGFNLTTEEGRALVSFAYVTRDRAEEAAAQISRPSRTRSAPSPTGQWGRPRDFVCGRASMALNRQTSPPRLVTAGHLSGSDRAARCPTGKVPAVGWISRLCRAVGCQCNEKGDHRPA